MSEGEEEGGGRERAAERLKRFWISWVVFWVRSLRGRYVEGWDAVVWTNICD